MKKTHASVILEFTMPSRVDHIKDAVQNAVSAISNAVIKLKDEFGLQLALYECITNAAVHGNKLDPRKSVTVRITLSGETLSIVIADQGAGFDWKEKLKAPLADPECPSGRGLRLMSNFGFTLSYNDTGNVLTLEKNIMEV